MLLEHLEDTPSLEPGLFKNVLNRLRISLFMDLDKYPARMLQRLSHTVQNRQLVTFSVNLHHRRLKTVTVQRFNHNCLEYDCTPRILLNLRRILHEQTVATVRA